MKRFHIYLAIAGLIILVGVAAYLWRDKLPSGSAPTGEMPNLDKPTVFASNIDGSTKENIVKHIEEIKLALKENNDNFDKWLELGNYLMAAGDYGAAEEVLNYTGFIRPKNAVSFHNQAKLYGYYLHDYEKARDYFEKAIANDPQNSAYYLEFFRFYRDINDLDGARQILQRAIDAGVPNADEIRKVLDSLK